MGTRSLQSLVAHVSPPSMSTSLTTFEDDDVDNNEDEDETRAPFLKHDDHDAPIPRKPTPLPIRQFSVLLSLWLAESIVEHSISPYLNQVRNGVQCGDGGL